MTVFRLALTGRWPTGARERNAHRFESEADVLDSIRSGVRSEADIIRDTGRKPREVAYALVGLLRRRLIVRRGLEWECVI